MLNGRSITFKERKTFISIYLSILILRLLEILTIIDTEGRKIV